MNITIIGAGQVGINIAKFLSKERHAITIIDNSQERIENIDTIMDVRTIVGDATEPSVLEEAGLTTCDMLICVTKEDNLNLFICQLAHALFDVKIKIARLHNNIYLSQRLVLFSEKGFNISDIIETDSELASDAYTRIEFSFTEDAGLLLDKQLIYIGLPYGLLKNNGLNSIDDLVNFSQHHKLKFIATVNELVSERLSQIKRLQEDSLLYFTLRLNDMPNFMAELGLEETNHKRILLVSGSNYNHAFLDFCKREEVNYSFTLIEKNQHTAHEVVQEFPEVLVLNGNVSDKELLKNANLDKITAALVNSDSTTENLIHSVVLKNNTIPFVLSSMHDDSYNFLKHNFETIQFLDACLLGVKNIVPYLRPGNIKHAALTRGGLIEFLEYEIHEDDNLCSKFLFEIEIPLPIQILYLYRDEIIMELTEEIVLKPKDRLLVAVEKQHINLLNDLFG